MEQTKDLSRALRRHHIERLKTARRGYWGHSGPYAIAWTERRLGMVVQTAHPCSCWMCGNPRRYFGERTIQELRWAQHSLIEQLADTAIPERATCAGANSKFLINR